MEDNKRGGARPGAGRPKGDPRPQHQVRAYDDEWDVISRFAAIVKGGQLEACRAIVGQLENNE